jgi:hypothetical protein
METKNIRSMTPAEHLSACAAALPEGSGVRLEQTDLGNGLWRVRAWTAAAGSSRAERALMTRVIRSWRLAGLGGCLLRGGGAFADLRDGVPYVYGMEPGTVDPAGGFRSA